MKNEWVEVKALDTEEQLVVVQMDKSRVQDLA
jgi:hypothetical protein